MEPGLKLVKNEKLAEPKEITNYQLQIGVLMYLMCITRPDLAFVVCNLARFM